EDEEAARSLGINTFRYKMIAVVISGGMTAVAGVFFAFYYNNLFPEQVFHISRSIEIILGPIIGGIGAPFGPIVGAFLLTGASELMQNVLIAIGFDVPRGQPGILRRRSAPGRHCAPRRRLAVAGRETAIEQVVEMNELLEVQGIGKRFRGLLAVDDVSFRIPQGS